MKKLFFLFLLCGLFLLFACQKSKIDTETTTTTDFSLVTQEFIQLISNINERAVNKRVLVTNYNAALPLPTGCTVDSIPGDTVHDAQGNFTDTIAKPLILWMQYNNCPGPDGKIRNGAVSVRFYKKYDLVNSRTIITLQNYIVNGVSYQGSLLMVRISPSQFTLVLSNGACNTGTATIKYSFMYTITLLDNGTPTNASDDIIQATGSSSGNNREGRNFSSTTNNMLSKWSNCSWIAQGNTNLSPAGLHSRTVDFGNGTCDDIGTFIVDGQTFTVHLPK